MYKKNREKKPNRIYEIKREIKSYFMFSNCLHTITDQIEIKFTKFQ